jgi:His/Glu/Gln/Arg/opine family amino acid ABC transporter permease subunit
VTADAIVAELLTGATTTGLIALGAWIVAAVVGLLIAVVRNLRPPVMGGVLDGTVIVLRSVPQLIVVYLLFFGLGAIGLRLGGVVAVILALGITDAAFTAEFYRGGLRTVPEQQREAGLSLGLSRLQVMRLIVLPQTIPFLIPPLLNTFIGLLKTATIASAVGAPEILYRGQAIISRSGIIIPVALSVIGLYVVVTWPLTQLVAVLESRVRARGRASLS